MILPVLMKIHAKSHIGSSMHGTDSCLVTRIDQSISQYDIFPSPSSKHHDLRNIFWGQRFTSTIYSASASALIGKI